MFTSTVAKKEVFGGNFVQEGSRRIHIQDDAIIFLIPIPNNEIAIGTKKTENNKTINVIKIYNYKTGKLKRQIPFCGVDYHSVYFSLTGNLMASKQIILPEPGSRDPLQHLDCGLKITYYNLATSTIMGGPFCPALRMKDIYKDFYGANVLPFKDLKQWLIYETGGNVCSFLSDSHTHHFYLEESQKIETIFPLSETHMLVIANGKPLLFEVIDGNCKALDAPELYKLFKTIVPGKPLNVALSPDGNYLVVQATRKLHVAEDFYETKSVINIYQLYGDNFKYINEIYSAPHNFNPDRDAKIHWLQGHGLFITDMHQASLQYKYIDFNSKLAYVSTLDLNTDNSALHTSPDGSSLISLNWIFNKELDMSIFTGTDKLQKVNSQAPAESFPSQNISEKFQAEMRALYAKYSFKSDAGKKKSSASKDALLFLSKELDTEKSYADCVKLVKEKYPQTMGGLFKASGLKKLMDQMEMEHRKISGLDDIKFEKARGYSK